MASIKSTYPDFKRADLKAYRQLHTGSDVCWGHGWAELQESTINIESTEDQTECVCVCGEGLYLMFGHQRSPIKFDFKIKESTW